MFLIDVRGTILKILVTDDDASKLLLNGRETAKAKS